MKVTNGLLNSVPTLLATSGGTTTTKQRNKLPLHKTTQHHNNNHLQQNYQQQNQNNQNISQSANFAETVNNNYAGSSNNNNNINMNPTITSSSHLPANLANNLVSLHDDDFIGSASEFIKGTTNFVYYELWDIVAMDYIFMLNYIHSRKEDYLDKINFRVDRLQKKREMNI